VAPALEGDYPAMQAYVDGTAAGTFVPVEPKFAASVMLVRDAREAGASPYHSRRAEAERIAPINNIEVFMIRRQKTMSFVPDAVVFPGGRVDDKDSDERLPWAGPTPEQWAERLGRPVEVARRAVVAAVREVFEESGILLAGPSATELVDDVSGPEWLQARRDLVEHKMNFAEFLIERGLAIRTDLLNYCSNWCTPEFSPQRFDTFFFAARCPEGQHPDDLSREAYIADWAEPQWVFDMADTDKLVLLPPTAYNLQILTRASDIDELMSTEYRVRKIMEVATPMPDGTFAEVIVLP